MSHRESWREEGLGEVSVPGLGCPRPKITLERRGITLPGHPGEAARGSKFGVSEPPQQPRPKHSRTIFLLSQNPTIPSHFEIAEGVTCL